MPPFRTIFLFLAALLLPPLFPVFLLSLVPLFLGGEPAILKSDVGQRYLIYFTNVFLPSIKTLLIHKWKGETFRCGEDVYIPPRLLRDKGFEAQTGRKAPQDLWVWPRVEADYLIDGGRRRSFEAALRWLSTCPAERVVVNGPMDTTWLRATDGSVPLAALDRFQGILADAAKRYPGMTFLDSYPDGVPGLEAASRNPSR